MIRMAKIGIMMVLCMSGILGCQSGTGLSSAIEHASNRISRSIKTSYSEVYSQPVSLLTRGTVCDCDENLEYEVELFGQWRHVLIIGTEDALLALKQEKQKHSQGTAFEVQYLLRSVLYTSVRGQQYHVLELVDGI